MTVLDELRKTLGNDPHGDGWQTDDILSEIYAFEAAHPLLHECEEPIKCHKCKEEFPSCSWTEDWGEREIMLCNSDGEIDDHEFVPICPDCAKGEGLA